MNYLEFAKQSVDELSKLNGKEFANSFIEKRMLSYRLFHNNLVTSSSHGLNYFENVIKYWDNPDSYYTKDKKKLNNENDYEENFVKILKTNKK